MIITVLKLHRLLMPLAPCRLQVIDPVEDYLKLMRKIFDFGALKV